jgi:hypothetical protein
LPFLIAFGIAPTICALDLAFTGRRRRLGRLHNFTRTYQDFRFVQTSSTSSSTCVWLPR